MKCQDKNCYNCVDSADCDSKIEIKMVRGMSKEEKDKELQLNMMEMVEYNLKKRREVGSLTSQSDFLSGAMSAMTVVLPDSLSMPPRWIFSTIRGEEIGGK